MSHSIEPLQPDIHGTLTRLWLMAAGTYGAKWAKYFGDLPLDDNGQLTVPGRMWAIGLNPFPRATVLATWERLILTGGDWPPTLQDLRAACYGIPAFAAVRAELATPNATRSPFARLVWMRLDSYRYRQSDAERSDRLLREAYDLAREHVLRGGALPGPLAELAAEKHQRVPASPEVAAKSLHEIAEILNHDDAGRAQP